MKSYSVFIARLKDVRSRQAEATHITSTGSMKGASGGHWLSCSTALLDHLRCFMLQTSPITLKRSSAPGMMFSHLTCMDMAIRKGRTHCMTATSSPSSSFRCVFSSGLKRDSIYWVSPWAQAWQHLLLINTLSWYVCFESNSDSSHVLPIGRPFGATVAFYCEQQTTILVEICLVRPTSERDRAASRYPATRPRSMFK